MPRAFDFMGSDRGFGRYQQGNLFWAAAFGEDCLLPGLDERQLTRKLPLGDITPATEFDPKETLRISK